MIRTVTDHRRKAFGTLSFVLLEPSFPCWVGDWPSASGAGDPCHRTDRHEHHHRRGGHGLERFPRVTTERHSG